MYVLFLPLQLDYFSLFRWTMRFLLPGPAPLQAGRKQQERSCINFNNLHSHTTTIITAVCYREYILIVLFYSSCGHWSQQYLSLSLSLSLYIYEDYRAIITHVTLFHFWENRDLKFEDFWAFYLLKFFNQTNFLSKYNEFLIYMWNIQHIKSY